MSHAIIAALTELADADFDAVVGGTYTHCGCYCPGPSPGGANPGNDKPVGNAGEHPPGQGSSNGMTGDRGNSR